MRYFTFKKSNNDIRYYYLDENINVDWGGLFFKSNKDIKGNFDPLVENVFEASSCYCDEIKSIDDFDEKLLLKEISQREFDEAWKEYCAD